MSQKNRQTDEELMWRLSRGELKAAGYLFERYQLPLYIFFRRQFGDQTLSEDLTQNVFERMIRYKKSYIRGMSFKSWVFQIARNVRADQFKSQKVKVSNFADAGLLAQPDDSTQQKLESKEQLNQLQSALQKLSRDQREVLELTRFQKLKYSEVAHLLGCTEGAVKVKVHRAIHQLRKHFFKMEKL